VAQLEAGRCPLLPFAASISPSTTACVMPPSGEGESFLGRTGRGSWDPVQKFPIKLNHQS